MHKLFARITDELNQVLETLAQEETIGELVERLLREHPEVEKTRKRLKICYPERRTRGRPKPDATE